MPDGEIERAEGGELVSRRVFSPASDTNWGLIEERQDDIDGILESTEDPEKRVAELNTRFSGAWNDETGAGFLHILGEELPGLEIHERAKGLVIVGSYLPGLNIEGADLEASVWSMSHIDNLRARGANLNMSIWPMTRVSGDMREVQAVDVNFNLARLDIQARRARFAAAFMIGTQGITAKNLREADFRQTVVMPNPEGVNKRRLSATDIMRNANSRRFLDAREGEVNQDFIEAVLHRDFDASNALEAGRVAEGQIWINGELAGARMTEFELTASVLDNVGMGRAHAKLMKAAGLVTRLSDFGGIEWRGSWLPGSIHIDPNLTGANISEGNWPGSVLINPLLRGINATETNLDGSLVITDLPGEILEEQAKGRLRIVKAEQLAPEIQNIVAEATAGLSAPRKRKLAELSESSE